jgi:hypothetical protein
MEKKSSLDDLICPLDINVKKISELQDISVDTSENKMKKKRKES